MPRWTSGSSPRRSRLASQARNPARIRPPAAITKGVSERPKGSIGELLRQQPAPVARLQDSEDHDAEAGGGEQPADPVEPRSRTGPRRLPDQPHAEQDADHDDDLAGEDHAPAQLRRRPAAEDRPDGDPGAGDAAEHAVGEGPILAFEVGGDQGDHRRHHQRGADPLEDRPAEHQARDAPGGRRERRAAAVDAEPDREDASPSHDVAQLAAGEHQPRHHQRVERDHDLDRGHRGVEVLDELGDRDVHHRLVEDHQELRRAEDGQDSPFRHAATLSAV